MNLAGRIGARRGDRLFAALMFAPAALILLALNVYPFLTAIYSSFFSIHTITRETHFVGLDNYTHALGDLDFWAALGRSLLWTTSGIAIQVVLALGVALLLHRELKGRWVARGLVLFPYLVPAVVAALVWRYMFDPLTGIVNYLLVDVTHLTREPIAWLADPSTAMIAVILVGIWKFTPFMIILFLARLQTIPLELHEAAKIDGASSWQAFRYVTLAWLRPILLVALLLRSLWLFNEFDVTYLMAHGGPVKSTTTLPVLIRQTAFGVNDMGAAAAISMLMVVILIVASYFYLRSYERSEADLRT